MSPWSRRGSRDCGVPAPVRSSRWRRFVHVPLGKAGVRLLVRCRRYECRGCGGAWEDDLSRVAADGRTARLLDVVGGGSGAAFAGWLASRSEEFRRNVRVVAMDAFAGYKHAVRKAVPHAREVLDPFHVVRLAGDKLTQCRQRLQQEATGRRGTKQDPLYRPAESCSRPTPPSPTGNAPCSTGSSGTKTTSS